MIIGSRGGGRGEEEKRKGLHLSIWGICKGREGDPPSIKHETKSICFKVTFSSTLTGKKERGGREKGRRYVFMLNSNNIFPALCNSCSCIKTIIFQLDSVEKRGGRKGRRERGDENIISSERFTVWGGGDIAFFSNSSQSRKNTIRLVSLLLDKGEKEKKGGKGEEKA